MSKATDIAFLIDSLNAGGAERQTVELIKGLDRSRFQPRLYCLESSRSGFSTHFLPEIEEAGCPVDDLDTVWRLTNIPRTLLRLQHLLVKEPPDILHAVGRHSNHLSRLVRPCLPRCVRLLCAIRTDYNVRQFLYERLEHRMADQIVCNNKAMEMRLLRFARIPRTKLQCIPNGIDIDRFASNPQPNLRAQLGLVANRVVVMMARIAAVKAPQHLAKAVALLRSQHRLDARLRVIFVGEPNPGKTQTELHTAIREGGIASVCHQLPQTEHPEAFFHAADFSALPSLSEGLPNSALESLAAGKPVLLSSAANAAEVITPGVTGWLHETANVEDLANRLEEIQALSDECLHKMERPCREQANRFSLPRMIDAYHKLYEDLLAF